MFWLGFMTGALVSFGGACLIQDSEKLKPWLVLAILAAAVAIGAAYHYYSR